MIKKRKDQNQNHRDTFPILPDSHLAKNKQQEDAVQVEHEEAAAVLSNNQPNK